MPWDPDEYQKFSAERSRPAEDLLAQLHLDAPRRIVDLGCGTGWLAQTMAERWPTAQVIGIDSSPEMLRQAQELAIEKRLQFGLGDIADWSPAGPVDLVVSNAALQWLGDHERLLGRLAAMLAPGGVLAVQMPHNMRAASHEAIHQTAAETRFAPKLAGVGLHRDSVQPIGWYARRLIELGLSVDAWETRYVHVLTGGNPVLEWLRGTALRPVLAALDPEERVAFEQALAPRLARADPSQDGVTLFEMSRVFFIARR